MNYNLASYFIYLPVLCFTTFYVGWILYKNGEQYLFELFEEEQLVKSINKVMLIGYYLTTCGYSVIKVALWENIITLHQLYIVLLENIGLMYLIIGSMHVFNVVAFKLFAINFIINHKNQ